MRDIEDVALAFDASCKEAGVRYAFVGGIAVIAWGQPRMTMDIDALVHLEKGQGEHLCKSLKKRAIDLDLGDLNAATREGTHVTAFPKDSSFHVDVKLARTRREVAEVEAAVDVKFADQTLRVARPEDVIAFKLLFGSPQDLADARSILVRNRARLDERLLQATCIRLGVGESLRKVLKEIATAGP